MTESISSLSRDTALRIALASRLLPGIDVGKLIEILHRRIDGPLDEESLKNITVTDLKTGFSSVDGEEDGEDIGIGLSEMKEAVRILWGESLEENLPTPIRDAPDRPGAIRVAVASNLGEQLDGHFGSCLRFLVYQLTPEERQLIDVRSTWGADESDDRNAFRAGLIADCHVLYVVSVGGPAAAKVVRAGVYPIKKEAGEAQQVLADLQRVMAGNPPPWLARIMGQSAEQRVRFERSDEEASL